MQLNWLKLISKAYKRLWYYPERERWLKRLRHKDILTPEEAAFYLNVSTEILLQEAASGRLPGKNIGIEWRFSKEALTNLFCGDRKAEKHEDYFKKTSC